jgi:peroxiredoxin Q/BCP
MITEGTIAPDFTLESTTGTFSLAAHKGNKNLVIIFYPKDNTPGWNGQLCAARDAADEISNRSGQVVAVNPGTLESHSKWSSEFGFGFPICEDIDKQVATAYGAIKPVVGGIQRCVFVVNRNGVVVWSKQGVPEIVEILDALDAANH